MSGVDIKDRIGFSHVGTSCNVFLLHIKTSFTYL